MSRKYGYPFFSSIFSYDPWNRLKYKEWKISNTVWTETRLVSTASLAIYILWLVDGYAKSATLGYDG